MINPINLLKTGWAASTAYKSIKGAYMSTNHAWLSTRFWMTAVSVTSTFWAAIHAFIPQPWASIIQIAGVGIYVVAETVRKTYVDIQLVRAQSGVSLAAPVASPVTATATVTAA